MRFPPLVWRLIRDYQIEYFKHHRRRWQKVILRTGPFFNRAQYFKPKAWFPPAPEIYFCRDRYVLCSIEVCKDWNCCNCVYVKVDICQKLVESDVKVAKVACTRR